MSFARNLNHWYRKNARVLPWRTTRDPYKIWISEIMLQQTTVNAVIPYYEKWVKQFPTVQHVAKAPMQRILKSWQGLGYYTRAKNIHKAAKIIIKEHKGKLPDTFEDLKRLPGFGPYTIGAVLSIAFDKRAPIIDANVRRVVMRLLAIKGLANVSKDKMIYQFLDEVMPAKNLKTFNQAMMELGALVCRNKEPICSVCPVRHFCKGYAKGVQEIIPETKKKVLKELDVAIGVIERRGKYLIQKRPTGGLLADLWEFPGGKINPRESTLEALKRELNEELDIDITKAEHIMNVRHFYTSYKVNLHVYRCTPSTYPTLQKEIRWVSLNGFSKYPMPSGTSKIVDGLANL